MCGSADVFRKHLLIFSAIVMVIFEWNLVYFCCWYFRHKIFQFIGFIQVAVGSWVISSADQNSDEAQVALARQSNLVRALAISLIVCGSFAVLAIFCGYYGTYRESKKITKIVSFFYFLTC